MTLSIPDDRGPATPVLVTQDRLVAAVRAVARRSAESPKVKAALAAAEAIPLGIVLSTEDAAADAADSVRTIIDGEKALRADLAKILSIPKAMEDAARAALGVELSALAAAKQRGNDARVAYQQDVRRRAAEAEAAAKREADAAAEAAAIAAIETGEDVPPPAEIAPVAVARTVIAGKAKSGTQVRIEATEIVDDKACPVTWKVVVRAIAEGFFRTAEEQGRVQRAKPGESVVWCGVRFKSVEKAVNR